MEVEQNSKPYARLGNVLFSIVRDFQPAKGTTFGSNKCHHSDFALKVLPR